MADYMFLVQMDVPEELEDDFNRIYDEQHVPEILKVPGVHGCTRYRMERARNEGVPRYCAVYEIDSPDLPDSPEWKAASDIGDWAPKIRPHTTNRIHAIYRKIG